MIALGLALVLIAAGTTAFAVVASTTSSAAGPLTAFGVTVSASPLAIFVAGALAVVLLGLGFALISRGTRRTARTRKELKQLRKDNAKATTRTAAERADQDADGSPNNTAGDNTAGDGTPKHAVKDTTAEPTDSAGDTAHGSGQGSEAPLERHPEA